MVVSEIVEQIKDTIERNSEIGEHFLELLDEFYREPNLTSLRACAAAEADWTGDDAWTAAILRMLQKDGRIMVPPQWWIDEQEN